MDHNGSNEPRNIHESIQNQSHPINYSEQISEKHKTLKNNKACRLLAFPCDENAKDDLILRLNNQYNTQQLDCKILNQIANPNTHNKPKPGNTAVKDIQIITNQI